MAPPALGVYTVEQPVAIKTLLARLNDRDGPAEAIRSLAARDDAMSDLGETVTVTVAAGVG